MINEFISSRKFLEHTLLWTQKFGTMQTDAMMPTVMQTTMQTDAKMQSDDLMSFAWIYVDLMRFVWIYKDLMSFAWIHNGCKKKCKDA